MKKIRILSILFFIHSSIVSISTTDPYLIIWDLGDTLIYVTIPGMVAQIGIADCVLYQLFHAKDRNHLQNRIFDVLEAYGGIQEGPLHDRSYHTASHRQLPKVMCDWLAGIILEPKKLVKKIHRKMKELSAQNFFKNELEYRIIKNAVAAIFNPDVLIKNTRVLKEALEIVKEIALSGLHRQTILSNWDGVSYDQFKASPAGQELSRYFNMDDITISGMLNIIKPQQVIFEECLKRFGVTPEKCIFIDDQKENIDAARSYGLIALQIKNHDFKQLRKDLASWGIL